jgi:NDP-sugar pyrophosphorylase family protein
MRREVIERYRTAPMPLDLGRIQSDLVQRGEMAAFEVEDRFYEIGRPEGLAELEREMQRWSDGAMG